MTTTEHSAAVGQLIAAIDNHDLERYLAHFTEGAILEDPSVGRQFVGHEGLAEYFRQYFIGYNTRTRLLSAEPRGDLLHVKVDFTGDFPGGQTGGVFDLTFDGERVDRVTASLA